MSDLNEIHQTLCEMATTIDSLIKAVKRKASDELVMCEEDVKCWKAFCAHDHLYTEICGEDGCEKYAAGCDNCHDGIDMCYEHKK